MATASKNKTTKTDFVDEDGFFCLRGTDLWRWRALEAELRAETVELENVKRDIQIEISKNLALKAMLEKQTSLGSSISIAKTELLKVQAEIESLFGVSLKDCAFDDKTGRLYHLADGERGEAVKPKTAKTKTKSVVNGRSKTKR